MSAVQYTITEFNPLSKNIAILLESRFTEESPMVIGQFCRFLSSQWAMRIYCTPDVFQSYMNLATCLGNNIEVIQLNYQLTCVNDYNNIMLDIDFWKGLSAFEKVLIFQLDTMIFKYGIEKYLMYDYIGAPWPTFYKVRVGNGGLSIRNIQGTIECIKQKNDIFVDSEYIKDGFMPEDIFYAYAFTQLGYNVAPVHVAKLFSVELTLYNKNCIGAHKLNIMNNYLYKSLTQFSLLPYKINESRSISVLTKLNCLSNNEGILLVNDADNNYLWKNDSDPINEPWVGIVYSSPQHFLYYRTNNRTFRVSLLTNCKGIFTFSSYSRTVIKYFLDNLGYPDIEVQTIRFPIIEPVKSFYNYYENQPLVFMGQQMRKVIPFLKLQTSREKVWITDLDANGIVFMLNKEKNAFNMELANDELISVKIKPVNFQENLLCSSIVIIDLLDASVCKSVIKCIASNTPFFVSKLPAMVECVGENYPLFFTSYSDVHEKLANTSSILAAHEYLKSMDKSPLSMQYFINSIYNSEITKKILTQE